MCRMWVGMVCLVLLMYLFTSVMSKLALTLSPSFFGVRTTLLHQSVGSSPTSSMMSKSCHLSRICSNLSFKGRDTLLCFCTAPGALGSTCSFTVTPLSFPMPVKTSLAKRLVIYKLFSCFPNIPRKVIAPVPPRKYGLLLKLSF